MSNNSKMVQCKAILTMADQWKVVYDLLNGAISSDLEWLLPPLSRSRHSLALNISETVWDRDVHIPYSTVSFQMTLSDLAKYSMTRSITRALHQLSFLFILLFIVLEKFCWHLHASTFLLLSCWAVLEWYLGRMSVCPSHAVNAPMILLLLPMGI